MKRIILTGFFAIVALYGYSQETSFGVKGGVNLSTLYIDEADDQNLRTGFHAGFFIRQQINSTFAFSPELLFSTAGATATYNTFDYSGEVRFKSNYIKVPVAFSLTFLEVLEIHGGPYAAYLVDVSTETQGDFGNVESDLNRDNFKDIDMGAFIGAGLNFGNVQAGARYSLGLVPIEDSFAANLFLGDSKNAVGQVYLAVKF